MRLSIVKMTSSRHGYPLVLWPIRKLTRCIPYITAKLRDCFRSIKQVFDHRQSHIASVVAGPYKSMSGIEQEKQPSAVSRHSLVNVWDSDVLPFAGLTLNTICCFPSCETFFVVRVHYSLEFVFKREEWAALTTISHIHNSSVDQIKQATATTQTPKQSIQKVCYPSHQRLHPRKATISRSFSKNSHSANAANSLDNLYLSLPLTPSMPYSTYMPFSPSPLTPSAQSKEMAAFMREQSAYWRPIYEEEVRRGSEVDRF